MKLPEPAAEAAKWFLLVGLAFFSADALSAVIETRVKVPEKPLPQAVVGSVLQDVPAQAVPPGLIDLLRTTEPRKEANPTGEPELADGGEESPASAPQLEQLSLQGTMAGSDGAGLAVLGYQGASRVVSTGEQIGGFTLKSVSAFAITLEREGRIYSLDLDSQAATSPTLISSPQAPVPIQTPEAIPLPEETPEQPEETPEPILSVEELRNILDNPEGFMGQGFTAKPEMEDEQVVGMRVKMNSSHPLARLGIQNGDLVKSLNGASLEGPDSFNQVYRTLRNSSTLRFEVERDGVEQTVEVFLEE